MIKIISPHIDDAFLSLGGNILNWKKQKQKIKVYNIFTISNSYFTDINSIDNYQPTTEEITTIRKAEEKAVGQAISFDYEFWDFLDYPLRENFSKEENKVMKTNISNRIQNVYSEGDILFLPLGVGHIDHKMINNMDIQISKKIKNIYYYEDLPHLCWGNIDYQDFYKQLIKTKKPRLTKINFPLKEKILNKYASQIHYKWIKSMKTYAYNPNDNHYYERYWISNSAATFLE